MSNSPQIPKNLKGKPNKVTLDILYEYIESLEKCREERESKHKTKLEAMLDNKFKSFKDKIETKT
jgi:hypothetical protein